MLRIGAYACPSDEQVYLVLMGMRNPMNSWDKSDSEIARDGFHNDYFDLGEEDRKCSVRLVRAGEEHRKHLRMLPMIVDISAPLYWWKQFDKYQIGVVTNSCSTMHKMFALPFSKHMFAMENLNDPEAIDILNKTIDYLNWLRSLYIHWDETATKYVAFPTRESVFQAAVQVMPESYIQTRTVSMNYEVMYKIYHQRSGHKLGEWKQMCDWIENAPYFRELTGIVKED